MVLLRLVTNLLATIKMNVSQVTWEISRQTGWQSKLRVLLQRLFPLLPAAPVTLQPAAVACGVSDFGNPLLASALASFQTERAKNEAASAAREKELRNQSVADRTAHDKFVLDMLKQVQAGDKGVANASKRSREPSQDRARSPPGSRSRRHRSRSRSRSRRRSRSGRRCSRSRDRNKNEQRPALSGSWAWVEPGHWEWVYDSW